MNKARKITFPNVGMIEGSRVWRNSETGIEIIKGKNFKEVGLYYVCVPSLVKKGSPRRIVGHQTSLSMARSMAIGYVYVVRQWIAEAYEAACLEDSDREGARIEQERPMLNTYREALYAAKSRQFALDLLHQEALDEDSTRDFGWKALAEKLAQS